MTRRLALNLIQAANPYLNRMSSLLRKTPTELRAELATMERDVAMASTQRKVSQKPTAVLEGASVAAELAVELNISQIQQSFRLRFRGRKGSEAVVGCSRPELQRVIHMVEQEAVKAGWREAPPAASPQIDRSETKRRAH